MNATEILRLAAACDAAAVDKMAHALGWPSSYALTKYALKKGAKSRPTNLPVPYRNYYCGVADDPDWLAAQSLGLAVVARTPCEGFPDTTWAVTDVGRAVVRIRLQAAQLAYRVKA